jgi:hypothetical protein
MNSQRDDLSQRLSRRVRVRDTAFFRPRPPTRGIATLDQGSAVSWCHTTNQLVSTDLSNNVAAEGNWLAPKLTRRQFDQVRIPRQCRDRGELQEMSNSGSGTR